MGEELIPIMAAAAPSEASKPFQQAIGNTLADVWHGIVGDKIAAWRISNAAEINRKLVEKISVSGLQIDRSKISDRYAFSWFEEATKQDEPELQELFADLLIKASIGDKDALDRRHLRTLSQFTPLDTVIFEKLFQPSDRVDRVSNIATMLPRWSHETTVRRLAMECGEDAGNSVEHLINLGVLARGFRIETAQNSRFVGREPVVSSLKIKNEIIATGLGWSLRNALKTP